MDNELIKFFLTALALVAVLFIFILATRPGLSRRAGGKILAFFAFLVLPGLFTTFATSTHMNYATSTQFCLSCHEMGPYGDSLLRDDMEYLPASHYQNNRIPREKACFTCHTSYTMFGGTAAKIRGLKHVYVHYLGSIPDELELYEPYHNRECLHCHEGARSYLEDETHADMLEELRSNETSCLDCHDMNHETESIADAELWEDR